MTEESTFRQSLEFFNDLGVYDVILPFLLVFTLVFAMLEKTKVLGTEKIGDNDHASKKSLNAIVSFVMAFFVVASVQLVNIVHQVLAQAVLLIIAGVLLILFVNIFKPTGAGETNEGDTWLRYSFVIVAVLVIIGVFLNNLMTADGETWLSVVLGFAAGFGDGGEGSSVAAAAVLFLVTIGILFIILKSSGGGNGKKET